MCLQGFGDPVVTASPPVKKSKSTATVGRPISNNANNNDNLASCSGRKESTVAEAMGGGQGPEARLTASSGKKRGKGNAVRATGRQSALATSYVRNAQLYYFRPPLNSPCL